MKKTLAFLFCFLLIIYVPGCSGNNEADGRLPDSQAGVEAVLQKRITDAEEGSVPDPALDKGSASDTAEAGTDSSYLEDAGQQDGLVETVPEAETISEEDMPASGEDGIDVDLTALSSTMVYSEVYSMLYDPDRYIGKTVKMHGTFTAYNDPATGNTYYACIIKDAAACCAQGMEFELEEGYRRPIEGGLITVVGVFDTYMEGGNKYCTLRDARLV